MNRLVKQIMSRNLKISDLYRDWESGLIEPSNFQRKLVWRKGHKVKLIETILLNFPFPEVYVADGPKKNIDGVPHTIQQIIDGQQRLTTVFNYINGTDVFSSECMGLKPFQELSPDEQGYIVDYQVTVRDIGNVDEEVMVEIFDRINQSAYTLTRMEKDHAQYLDSEFLVYCKLLTEIDFNPDDEKFVKHKVKESDRTSIIKFFQEEVGIFSDSDNDRMYSLQYMMSLVATIFGGKYFSRNSGAEKMLKEFNEDFPGAEGITKGFLQVIPLLTSLVAIENDSIWKTKSNIFSLMVELSRLDIEQLNESEIFTKMDAISKLHKKYLNGEKLNDSELVNFFETSREGVNQLNRREQRGEFITKLLLG